MMLARVLVLHGREGGVGCCGEGEVGRPVVVVVPFGREALFRDLPRALTGELRDRDDSMARDAAGSTRVGWPLRIFRTPFLFPKRAGASREPRPEFWEETRLWR